MADTTNGDLRNLDEERMDFEEKKSLCLCVGSFLRNNLLLVLMLLSLVLGCCIGLGIKIGLDRDFTSDEIRYISFPGTIFLNMLKVMIIPLVVSSLISGMASLDQQASGKLGLGAVLYYFTTTFIAVILGIVLVMSIRPGKSRSKDEINQGGSVEEVNTADIFLDLLRMIFPSNIIEACFRTYKTHQVPITTEPMDIMTTMPMVRMMNTTEAMTKTMTSSMMNATTEMPMPVMTKAVGGYEYKTNILGLVVFSCVFGGVLGRLGDKGKPFVDVIDVIVEVVMVIIGYIIWLSPVGVFFLILGRILSMDDWALVFQQIGLYSATVIGGLLIHGFIILPVIFLIFTRNSPFRFLKGALPAVVTAFATASSSATLPITINSLETNNKIDPRVTRFVLPIGATIFMDGTALYEAISAVFIAQVNNMNLDASDIIVISITASLASIGAAGVPQSGIVTLVIVLNSVGLPADNITLVLVIEWFLDRFRTMVNVMSDAFCCGIIYKYLKPDFDRTDQEHALANGSDDQKKRPLVENELGEDTRL